MSSGTARTSPKFIGRVLFFQFTIKEKWMNRDTYTKFSCSASTSKIKWLEAQGGTRSSCNSLGNYGLITLLSNEAAHLLAIGAKNKILRRLIYRYTVVPQNFVWNTIQLHNNLPIFKFIWSWATWHHFANKCVKGEEVPYLEKKVTVVSLQWRLRPGSHNTFFS